MTRLLLATRNEGKLAELRAILATSAIDVELVGVNAFPGLPDTRETGLTFSENALIKARAAAETTGLPAVADDSGLCVDILRGMPGIFSARWAGRHGDDAANLELLLAQISDIADEHRTAAFVCAAAVAVPNGPERSVQGRLGGRLLRTPRGDGGFGYDPIFVPEDEQRTAAELSAAEKNAVSHRGQAFRALVPRIAEVLAEWGR